MKLSLNDDSRNFASSKSFVIVYNMNHLQLFVAFHMIEREKCFFLSLEPSGLGLPDYLTADGRHC